jgi:hypothetical protein
MMYREGRLLAKSPTTSDWALRHVLGLSGRQRRRGCRDTWAAAEAPGGSIVTATGSA